MIDSKLRNVLSVFVLTILSLSGCKKEPAAQKSTSSGIAWHKAGIVSALELSKKENRPLFVYWGAEWCPPCNVVKETVFKDKDFVSATKKFISVYLDGDTDSAQEWGEKLKASGYPTLMVLNPEGQEVVRLSTEMSPKEFSESLNSVYDNLHPMNELILKVLNTPVSQVSEKTWQIIAGYSWAQAKESPQEMTWAQAYSRLARRIPSKYQTEKDRLALNSIVARITNLKDEEDLSTKERAMGLKSISEIVASPERFQKQYKVFSYYAADFVKKFFTEKNDERDQFVEKLKASLKTARESYEIGSHGRLIGFYPLVEIARIKGETLPLIEKDLIKKEMLQAVDRIESSHEQVFVSSGSSYILREAGLTDLARETLLKDIKNSKTPFYAMASLASIEKKEGNKEEALKWIERAYTTSKGNATRLQWGSNFLIYMMELSPDQKDKILRELQKFYRVHLKQPDAFMGRNKKRLDRIAKSLKGWQEKSQDVRRSLKNLRKEWVAGCEKKSSSKTEFYREGCRTYFSDLI